MTLIALYQSLLKNSSGHAYTAVEIKECKGAYLAVNSSAYPSLIIESTERFGGPPLKAAKVCYRPSQQINITINGLPPLAKNFHVLICESADAVDTNNFLVLVDAFLATMTGQQVSGTELSLFFKSMVRLFGTKPAGDIESRRQGLWGELFLMREFRGFAYWAPFWHGSVTDLFDFSNNQMHVEVKAAIGKQRIHHFAHKQIWEEVGHKILIASLMLTPDQSGLSLRELINDCRKILHGSPDYLKLEFAVRHAGMEDETIIGPQFNEDLAKQDLLWFKATDAPHFKVPEPCGVSETSYKVDLTNAFPVAKKELNTWLSNWEPALAPVIT
jgi:hypothetical protein